MAGWHEAEDKPAVYKAVDNDKPVEKDKPAAEPVKPAEEVAPKKNEKDVSKVINVENSLLHHRHIWLHGACLCVCVCVFVACLWTHRHTHTHKHRCCHVTNEP